MLKKTTITVLSLTMLFVLITLSTHIIPNPEGTTGAGDIWWIQVPDLLSDGLRFRK